MPIEADAILSSDGEPFTSTSGVRSLAYADRRKIIADPRIRTQLIDVAVKAIEGDVGSAGPNRVASGETAGYPVAAWIADGLPMPWRPSLTRRSPGRPRTAVLHKCSPRASNAWRPALPSC